MKDTLNTRRGAAALMEALRDGGVRRIYGVPGEETTALITEMETAGITFVLCRHEQAAAFMASVEGRLTGRPGVCLATLGPGATNLVTGVADAQLDHVPLIAITGQGARGRMGRMSHQMIDLEALFAPVTKLSRTLLDADDVPGSVAEALRMATAEVPGAVHLCLPEDVAEAQTRAATVPVPAGTLGAPDPGALADVAARIKSAERPVFLGGAGVIRSGAAEDLRGLIEDLELPLATTFMAKGVLPEDHPQSLFTIGQPETDYVDLAFQAADLIVAVGFDPVEVSAAAITSQGEVPVVALAETPPRADAGWRLEGQAVGALTPALVGLRALLHGETWANVGAFEATRTAMEATIRRQRTVSPQGPVAPQDICRVVSDALKPQDVVLSGVGLHKLWIARHVMPKRPGQVIVPNGLAGMGLALPGAIAAATLRKEGRVLALCGDGDLMMNVQEMETAARLGLRLTVVVWEDGGYGLIDAHETREEDHAPRRHTFGTPVWEQLAQAFGWVHARADGVAALPGVLDAALGAEGPSLISVPVDYDAAGGLPKIAGAGTNAPDGR